MYKTAPVPKLHIGAIGALVGVAQLLEDGALLRRETGWNLDAHRREQRTRMARPLGVGHAHLLEAEALAGLRPRGHLEA